MAVDDFSSAKAGGRLLGRAPYGKLRRDLARNQLMLSRDFPDLIVRDETTVDTSANMLSSEPHMSVASALAVLFCAVSLFFHLGCMIYMMLHARRNAPIPPVGAGADMVTLLRPVCGLDFALRESLGSTFSLDYPSYEVIFCAPHESDPAVAVVRELMAAHPRVQARLLVGLDEVSDNPKLNNCYKGWQVAGHPWLIMIDSNVVLSRDYVQRMLAAWGPRTGLVTAPPIGKDADGFWGHFECAFLNTYQAPAQYFADFFRVGFAQGKNMLWRRADLERAGGVAALGSEVTDDAAATKLVRANGKRVSLVQGPFEQPIGRRTFAGVWDRQARWARMRRSCFPLVFLSEVLNGFVPPWLALAWLSHDGVLPFWPASGALAVLWYGSEAALVWYAGWAMTAALPLQAFLRDLLLPCLWVYGYGGSSFNWRGRIVSMIRGEKS